MSTGDGEAILEVTAPVRIADCGGWTDTWFAGTGVVCAIAVEPGVRVTVRRAGSATRLTVTATDESYELHPGDPPGRHPLLEAVVRRYPPSTPVELTVDSAVPPGSGMGTSAAVVVALLAALRSPAASDDNAGRATLAREAHTIETGLGLQSGVQDQFAAAFGGIGRLAVRYPEATWTGVVVSDATIRSLDRALVTVYLGNPHVSSDVHEQVIARLASTGGADRLLAPMRRAAETAADALAAGDLPRFGAALVANTDAQAALHAELISADAHRLIALGAEHHALGWKVNGAGGEGGTVTLLADGDPAPLRSAIASSGFAILDLRIARRGVTSARRVAGEREAGERDWVSAAADP